MRLKFDDLKIGDKFEYNRREWQKFSQFSAKCLSKDSPHDPEAKIAFDRNKEIEIADDSPLTLFRKRR